MKMGSDLGKMYRRNYMVKSQLNSLEAKSRALNEKITDETQIDEWAESYITRADAQIDDVSDYMNFRNLGSLQGFTDFLPQVTGGNTLGAVLMLGLMGATLGVVTYDEYRGKRNVKSMLVPRLKRMGLFAAGGAGLAIAYQGVVGAGQKTGLY